MRSVSTNVWPARFQKSCAGAGARAVLSNLYSEPHRVHELRRIEREHHLRIVSCYHTAAVGLPS